jgi:hypothetical protein
MPRDKSLPSGCGARQKRTGHECRPQDLSKEKNIRVFLGVLDFVDTVVPGFIVKFGYGHVICAQTRP